MTLCATAVAAAYAGRPVFSNLSLTLQPGEVVAIIGPNGAGKTTLLRILAGLLLPAAGAVALGGRDLHGLPARARARAIGVMLEAPDATFGFTARELVLLGRFPHLGRMGYASQADLARAEQALLAVELSAHADRPYPTLSSGERQRVAIARLLCQDPDVLLLDEPTSRLDPAHALALGARLRDLARAGKTVVATMHDLDLAARLASRVVVLAEGALIADGPPGDVLTPELIARVWSVRARRVDDGRPSIVLDAPLE